MQRPGADEDFDNYLSDLEEYDSSRGDLDALGPRRRPIDSPLLRGPKRLFDDAFGNASLDAEAEPDGAAAWDEAEGEDGLDELDGLDGSGGETRGARAGSETEPRAQAGRGRRGPARGRRRSGRSGRQMPSIYAKRGAVVDFADDAPKLERVLSDIKKSYVGFYGQFRRPADVAPPSIWDKLTARNYQAMQPTKGVLLKPGHRWQFEEQMPVVLDRRFIGPFRFAGIGLIARKPIKVIGNMEIYDNEVVILGASLFDFDYSLRPHPKESPYRANRKKKPQ